MPKNRKSMADWKAIVDDQQASGLSIQDYCLQNNVNYKTFGARKSDLNPNRVPTTRKPNNAFVSIQTSGSGTNTITLTLNKLNLSLPDSVSPDWLAKLIKALNT